MCFGKSYSLIEKNNYSPSDNYFQIQYRVYNNTYLFTQNILKSNINNQYDYWEIGILGGFGSDLETEHKNNRYSIFYYNLGIGYNFNNILEINNASKYNQYSIELGYGYQFTHHKGIYFGLSLKYDIINIPYNNIEFLSISINVKQKIKN